RARKAHRRVSVVSSRFMDSTCVDRHRRRRGALLLLPPQAAPAARTATGEPAAQAERPEHPLTAEHLRPRTTLIKSAYGSIPVAHRERFAARRLPERSTVTQRLGNRRRTDGPV